MGVSEGAQVGVGDGVLLGVCDGASVEGRLVVEDGTGLGLSDGAGLAGDCTSATPEGPVLHEQTDTSNTRKASTQVLQQSFIEPSFQDKSLSTRILNTCLRVAWRDMPLLYQ